MQIISLYKYIRPDGGTTVSTQDPGTLYKSLYRLVADEGKILTNGKIKTKCVDTENSLYWQEIDYQEEENDFEN